VEYETNEGRFIRYHDTDVVSFLADGSIRLNSNGRRTVTTKSRIQEHLPAEWFIYSDKSVWYVSQGLPQRTEYIYNDGMRILPDDSVVGFGSLAIVRSSRSVNRLISDYCRMILSTNCQSLLFCDVCAQIGTSGSLVDHQYKNHILQHLTSGVLMNTLLYNALKWAGDVNVGDVNISEAYDALSFRPKERIAHSVRRYVKANMGLPY